MERLVSALHIVEGMSLLFVFLVSFMAWSQEPVDFTDHLACFMRTNKLLPPEKSQKVKYVETTLKYFDRDGKVMEEANALGYLFSVSPDQTSVTIVTNNMRYTCPMPEKLETSSVHHVRFQLKGGNHIAIDVLPKGDMTIKDGRVVRNERGSYIYDFNFKDSRESSGFSNIMSAGVTAIGTVMPGSLGMAKDLSQGKAHRRSEKDVTCREVSGETVLPIREAIKSQLNQAKLAHAAAVKRVDSIYKQREEDYEDGSAVILYGHTTTQVQSRDQIHLRMIKAIDACKDFIRSDVAFVEELSKYRDDLVNLIGQADDDENKDKDDADKATAAGAPAKR